MRQVLMMSSDEKRFYDDCHNPTYKPILMKVFEEFLQSDKGQEIIENTANRIISEMRLLKRIVLLETYAGLDIDIHCVGEDWVWDDMSEAERLKHPEVQKVIVQPLNAQLSQMNERIDDSSIPVLHETVFAGNETDIRARLLLQKLPDYPMLNGLHQMSTKQVGNFLLNEVPEEHRTTEKSSRKIAADVMRRAVELFPEQIKLVKNSKKELKVSFIEKR